MAWLNVHFYSFALGQTCSMDVLLPEADAGIGVTAEVWDGCSELPVLYLLHGHSDDHTIWMRRTALERHFSGRRLAIVMPAVNRSFYTDQKCGYAYQSFIAQELPQICRRFFRISDRREDRYIAGLSMGGYGAMKLALNYPERYAAAVSMSGALDLLALPPELAFDDATALNPERMRRLRASDYARYYVLMDQIMSFGSLKEFKGSENDLCSVLERHLQQGSDLPRLFISMGTEDMLVHTNDRFIQLLEEYDQPFEHVLTPGMHEWSVWDGIIPQVLDWIAPKIT